MPSNNSYPGGLAFGLEEPYARFGYDSPEARRAEIEGLLDAQLGEAIAEAEKKRLVALHLAFHREQVRLLGAGGGATEDAMMQALTKARSRHFRAVDAALGHERFKQVFGDDVETVVAQHRAQLDISRH